jgi:hypothetical protein
VHNFLWICCSQLSYQHFIIYFIVKGLKSLYGIEQLYVEFGNFVINLIYWERLTLVLINCVIKHYLGSLKSTTFDDTYQYHVPSSNWTCSLGPFETVDPTYKHPKYFSENNWNNIKYFPRDILNNFVKLFHDQYDIWSRPLVPHKKLCTK